MPEGDALHRAARRLQPLVGQRLEVESPNPRAQATQVAPRVDGRVLESVEAVGKNLLLRFEGGLVVRSHLRMTGRWRIEPRGKPRAGLPWLVLRGETLEGVLWNGPVLTLEARNLRRLGQDVLAEEFDLEAAVARLRGASDRWLGEALQDQRLVAGIGNMWRAEALWEAKLSPWSRLRELSDDDLRSAVDTAARLMRAGVETGRPGRNVYRRPVCPRCGGRISSRGQGD
ncbi:MAG TPA: DNA-formamidopyrimidine glycosylase family protein, partial [Gaiellaceae bacterium]|nr:DNA-formamidopyrimidine glycosylase family protein [Gaiellaceae bacterium]